MYMHMYMYHVHVHVTCEMTLDVLDIICAERKLHCNSCSHGCQSAPKLVGGARWPYCEICQIEKERTMNHRDKAALAKPNIL